jgi:signal transduction histidine kinase/CheY-like chemotaxis protein
MVIPVVLAIFFVGIGIYFLVLRSVSDFAGEQITAALKTNTSEIYDICDEHFTKLMQAGKIADRKANVIIKAIAIGDIEEYIQRNRLGCRLIENEKKTMLQYQVEPDLLDQIIKKHSQESDLTIQFKGKRYYFQHFAFKPWGWHVGLVTDAAVYAPLIRRVKLVYIVTAILLLLGLALILMFQERLLRRPLNQIISAMRVGRSPVYKGITELEFLSDHISSMMSVIEEKNKWVEDLYLIAIAHRGEDSFKRAADALSAALGLNTLILQLKKTSTEFLPVAYASIQGNDRSIADSADGLPSLQIISEKEPIIVTEGAQAEFPAAKCLSIIEADSYAGLPIFDRDGAVSGTMNVFGKKRAFDEWDMHLIKTVCQMVSVEFEYIAKERDKEALERQLQQSKKMEAIGLLAGGVAHDLNNVLSGIVSYPDLLLLDLEENSPLREPILTMQNSGRKATEIVQDLLTLARRGVENKNVINLNDIVSEYLCSPEYKKLETHHAKVVVKRDLAGDLLNIVGAKTQLVKVVMNLVSNAAEAQPAGGEILLSTHNQYLDTPINGYETIPEGDYVVLAIQDAGFGISAQDLPKIFEPFYSKKVMGRSGTGLGMAVVWGATHDHQGFIDITSTEGIGTTFTLYFPVTHRHQVREQRQIPIEEYLGEEETILIVDDVEEQRKIAANILSKLNYKVITVPSGEDAVAYLETHDVALLILDMIMEPGMDGLETYKRILESKPTQKAIIASGYSETDRVKEVQRLGAGQYIKKPYTLEKIGIAVKKELES